jgi:aminoglycoside phosphotransferase family enzyme
MSKHFSPLVAAMLRPEFYLHKPTEVELRQTHISYVFIAGARVYKVKKNVKFPFLDYSTLDKRRHFCAEEVRLNRRLAPKHIYSHGRHFPTGKSFFSRSRLS